MNMNNKFRNGIAGTFVIGLLLVAIFELKQRWLIKEATLTSAIIFVALLLSLMIYQVVKGDPEDPDVQLTKRILKTMWFTLLLFAVLTIAVGFCLLAAYAASNGYFWLLIMVLGLMIIGTIVATAWEMAG